MLKNYLTVALRTLRRNKGYAAINVGSLAVGLAACLLALLYFRHETSYDTFHTKAKHIYRIESVLTRAGKAREYESETPLPLAEALRRTAPALASVVRVDYARPVVGTGEQAAKQDRFFRADPSFFEVFDGFSLLKGDPATALQKPRSLILTERMAHRYFGDGDPLGQTLTLRRKYDYTVTGVAENPPANTHLRFDFLASLGSESTGDWSSLDARTYVALRTGAAPADLHAALSTLVNRASTAVGDAEVAFEARALSSLHLYDTRGTLNASGRRLVLFSVVALFVLLMAGINYVNLSTARSTRRAKEVGVRKAAGAKRGQLMGQFLTESMLLSLAALVVALLIVRAVLPSFAVLAGTSLAPTTLVRVPILTLSVAVALAVGLLAGGYPALILSGFTPARVLSGAIASGQRGARLRRALVVFQFALTVALIAGALVIHRQLWFLHGKDLGFEARQQVVLRAYDLGERHEQIKQRMRQHASVEHVSATSCTPGSAGFEETVVRSGETGPPAAMRRCSADADFLSALDIKLKKGRGFSPRRLSDRGGALLINEAAAEQLRGEVLGQPLTWTQDVWAKNDGAWTKSTETRSAQVVGIVKDFHYASLHDKIEPLIIQFDPGAFDEFVAAVKANDIPAARSFLKDLWAEQAPTRNFEFEFVSAAFANAYQQTEREGRLVSVFASLAIFIACLGLFSLAAFAAERRRKEIAVRKTFGASVGQLVALLSKDFLKLVTIGFAVAAPLAYFAMQRWLEGFAYRIELGPLVFLAAGALALVVALVATGTQALRAARTNPAQALRDE